MSAFSEFDPDEQALVKKPRPLGWFFAGVASLATLALGFGYYVPLSNAHETLVGKHEKLAVKSSELDHALKEEQLAYKEAEQLRSDLRSFVNSGIEAKNVHQSSLDTAQATAENQLKVFVKAKLVSLENREASLWFSFSDKVFFRGKTAKTSSRAKRPLCAATNSLSGHKDWIVTIRTRAPIAEKKYWEIAGERAANLAKILEISCKVSADRLITHFEKVSESKSPAIGRTTLVVGPPRSPHLDLKKAPPPAEKRVKAE